MVMALIVAKVAVAKNRTLILWLFVLIFVVFVFDYNFAQFDRLNTALTAPINPGQKYSQKGAKTDYLCQKPSQI